jgi:hypothetical protein
MKILVLLLMCFGIFAGYSQDFVEKEIKTDVNEVTVFIDGAQIVRKKVVPLTKGKFLLKFVGLSPFIDAKSVQVKANGEITVLSVNQQQNFLDKLSKPKELTDLETKISSIEEKIKLENTHLAILREELSFLRDNRIIGGKNQEVSVNTLREATIFYSGKISTLKLKEIDLERSISDLDKQKREFENQIRTITSKKEFPSGEVLVKVDCSKDIQVPFELSYLVSNAGWFPSYDIRVNSVNEPVELIYKANVKQDTKEDWKNVKLKFSSSEPNVSGVAPVLKTWELNYNVLPPSYSNQVSRVSGKVMDNFQNSIPGANVVVQGTTIGAVTDISGNYSLTIPANASNIIYSFIGYQTKTLPISGSTMNVSLDEDIRILEEVVVRGYGTADKVSKALQGRTAGVTVSSRENLTIRGNTSLSIPVAQVEKQTTVDFEINIPFTVNSDNKSYSVDMVDYQLPAFYQYYSVPKIDRGAFLIANIIDWEKYSLLEGEANIFFEDTYVGKSLLDVRFASDTLKISLGKDKGISISREKAKNLTSKQFIGSKKEETRGWKTTVKNNKGQKINLVLFDQVPVSTNTDIEVIVQNITGAKHTLETGEVKWEFTLNPGESKELELKYSVKFPKSRNLIIE